MLKMLAEKIKDAGGDTAKIEALLEKGINSGNGRQMTSAQREAWISNLETIAEVRKALKIAAAKKSRTDGAERYNVEIKAGNERKNELIAAAEAHEDGKLAGYIAYGEAPEKLLQIYIEEIEATVVAALATYEEKMGKNAIKAIVLGMPNGPNAELVADIETKLGAEAVARFIKRGNPGEPTGDLRVRALNQKFTALNEVILKLTPAQMDQIAKEMNKKVAAVVEPEVAGLNEIVAGAGMDTDLEELDI